MTGPCRWIAVLLASLICGCVTSGVVHLDTGRGTPIVYSPPSDIRAVEVGQRDFVETVSRLVLDTRFPLVLTGAFRDESPLWRVGWNPGSGLQRREAPRERFVRIGWFASPGGNSLGASSQVARFTLAGAAANLTETERQNYALSFALDGVWAGVGAAVRATVDPVALKAMLTSALCVYMLLLVLPEPVTKFIAIALSAYLVAYVGYFPLWNMVKAYKQLRNMSAQAASLLQLEEAGRNFGQVVGDNGMRVLIMVMLAAAGGKSELAARGPTLPGYGLAAVAFESNTGLRLAAVAEGGVQAVSVQSGTLVVGVTPSAVATAAWNPGGGGGPKRKGSLTGRPSRPEQDSEARPIGRENETAQILAENGYDVEQNPPPRPNGRRPDYRVNGEYADCYAPTRPTARNIADGIGRKVTREQASIVIVNLEDTEVSIEALRTQVTTWPIKGLEKLLAIKSGQVVQLLP